MLSMSTIRNRETSFLTGGDLQYGWPVDKRGLSASDVSFYSRLWTGNPVIIYQSSRKRGESYGRIAWGGRADRSCHRRFAAGNLSARHGCAHVPAGRTTGLLRNAGHQHRGDRRL